MIRDGNGQWQYIGMLAKVLDLGGSLQTSEATEKFLQWMRH
jgi:hypothetical protein